ncbi:tRNA (adenosine(37)-N6)-dimethylallyltransferase MiaA [Rhodopirellula halodulae]|uniref:tRNA (adenosine(37)-N6)-dimethylallyltransferase MiaA n=1 Tax=Rhodopirellula halodulae TaxID=2894198 RepID=UPI001E3CD2D2|nr:tRNA (adenosine(37)-N6)-dimethylallyltransferase MiaA [Rhodopirellula sp. JC737]MCC9656581.1 tRNA (adenosine(37)-N6)-dimethylallyltransferase MiaA [Rhodopirellula sp. JC737]
MHPDPFPTPFAPLFDDVIVLTGPTASGKTGLAVRVAETLADQSGGRCEMEILSLDAIAVYRGMDIGSAKPTADQLARVPHHLIDLVDAWEEFSVAEYLTAAHAAVEDVRQRGKIPMFVGGTPMYLKGILRGFDAGPPADEAFRESVEADLKEHGIDALRARLQQVDPLSAAKIDPGDSRRMIRALEFARATGTPISHRQLQFDTARSAEEGLVFAMRVPRPVLHQRIEQRVEQMFRDGLVAEVQALLDADKPLSKTSRQAVGYREILEAIEQGQPAESAAEQVVFHTRRLARRQETWLRSFSEIRGLGRFDADAAPDMDVCEKTMVDAILQRHLI